MQADPSELDGRLREVWPSKDLRHKGPLCLALVMTRKAKRQGLPLEPNDCLTEGGGQVAGLGSAAVQAILAQHGIERLLASEGGRTSRGNIDRMKKYVELLNELAEEGPLDLEAVESWWVERVREYFASKPFRLKLDPSRSLRATIRDLLAQAEERQKESPGSTSAGTMLQHLIGAKLDRVLQSSVDHHGASVADSVSSRPGDFLVGTASLHVTTSPSEALIAKCKKNLEAGLQPVIITPRRKSTIVADGLAEQAGLADRIEVLDAEQFLAGNLYELSGFDVAKNRVEAEELVARYNEIIDQVETDPSLKIRVR